MAQEYTKLQYIEAGCMQFDIVLLGMALHNQTNGKLCPECPKNQSCTAQRKLQSIGRPLNTALPEQNGGETVRQEAARRNISIKEVRRQRRAAQLETGWPNDQ